MPNIYNPAISNPGGGEDTGAYGAGGSASQVISTGALQQNNWTKGGKTLGTASGIIGAATNIVGAAAPLFGAEQATIDSGATGVLNMAGDVASAFGPIGAAVGTGLKIIGMVNQFAGKKLKSQGTAGMTNTGYATQTSVLAGQKADLFTTLFNKKKMKGIENQTARADAANVKASAASYTGNQNSQLANNSYWDIQTKNQQTLQGGLNTKVLSSKKGGTIDPKILKKICSLVGKNQIAEAEADSNFTKYTKLSKHQLGGIIKSATKTLSPNPNLIPEGALHARKNNLPEELADQVTNKGVPVVSINGDTSDLQEHLQSGGTITQHAEIERNEIIFNLTNSKLFDEMFSKYKNSDATTKRALEIEAGKVLVQEILDNTIDKTNLLKTLENA